MVAEKKETLTRVNLVLPMMLLKVIIIRFETEAHLNRCNARWEATWLSGRFSFCFFD